jgi:hypothetical protein
MRIQKFYFAPGDTHGHGQLAPIQQPPGNDIEPGASGDYISHIVRSITYVKGYLWPRLVVHGAEPGKNSSHWVRESRMPNMHGWKVFIGSYPCLTHTQIRRENV